MTTEDTPLKFSNFCDSERSVIVEVMPFLVLHACQMHRILFSIRFWLFQFFSDRIAAAVAGWDDLEYMFETLSLQLVESSEVPSAAGNIERKCVRIANIVPPFKKVQ